MSNKKLSLVAVAIAVLALIVSLSTNLSGLFEKEISLKEPKIGKIVKIRERHFNRQDPSFSEVTTDEITIVASKDKKVFAKTLLGYEVTSTWNTFMPSLEEKSTDPKNPYLEKNTIFGDPLTLFPLKVGKKSSNRVVGDTTHGGGRAWEYMYNCEVMGKEFVQIALGTFETFKVVCTGTGNRNFRKTFYYEPNMEQVLMAERDSESSYYFELTEVIDPK